MMRNRDYRRNRKKPMSEINVVPYIDVMLVLLVIFMITAPLLTQGINVRLPQTSSKALSPNQQTPLIVSVNQQGNYFLNLSPTPTKAITPQMLMSSVAAYMQLAKQKHEVRHVYVKGDQNVDYGKVVGAMALLQKAGANEVGLITQPVQR